MPDNRLNGEEFKEFDPENNGGVNKKEEGKNIGLPNDSDIEKENTDIVSDSNNNSLDEGQNEELQDKSKDKKSIKSDSNIPFSKDSSANEKTGDIKSVVEEAPFIEKNKKDKSNNSVNEKLASNNKNSDKDLSKKEKDEEDKGISLGKLLEQKVIMIDDNDKINLADIKTSPSLDIKNIQNVNTNKKNEEDVKNKKEVSEKKDKKSDADSNLPKTFDELVAEKPGWKPSIKGEDKNLDTITGAITGFYKGKDSFKFPLLNDEDKKTTDFDISDGIYAYKRDEPYPHWHFVTNKLSDLYDILWDGAKLSGVGFEISFRVKSDETNPPLWGINFIQAFSGYAYSSGNFMANGHILNTENIIKFPKDSNMDEVAVVYDPDIKPIVTIKGKREFLQLVGVTKDEQIAIRSWNSKDVLEIFSKELKMFITDPKRNCLMKNEKVDKAIQDGIKRDGSNTGMIFSEELKWKKKRKMVIFGEYLVEVDRGSIKILEKVIKGRIPKGRELIIVGSNHKVIIKPSPNSYALAEGESLNIGLSPKSFHDFLGKIKKRVKIFKVKSLNKTRFKIK